MKRAWIALAVLLAACSGGGGEKGKTTLTVYTAAETDVLADYEKSFAAVHPEIKIAWVRDSTGVVTAKLLAEKAAPRADVVFALAATSLMLLDKEGLLAGYEPKGWERIAPRFKDAKQTPPHFVGEALWSSAICVNTVEAKKRGLPIPATWDDLTKPVYKGAVSMPDPASSGTGLLTIAGWLQKRGEAGGWAYMDALDANIASYVHSGSKPCQDAARGEIPIGVSFDFRAAELKSEGAPIEIVVPSEGVGWDIESTGIVAATKKRAAAEAFLDWTISDAAMDIYAKHFAVIGAPARQKPVAGLPSDLDARLVPMDLSWVADNRARIVAEWAKRYEAKAAAK